MSNWLAPLKRGIGAAGHMALSHYDNLKLISEGADIIMKQRRTDLIPNFHYGVPDGVSILNDEKMLEIYLAGMIAKSVRSGTWSMERFAYPAKKFSGIEYSPPWRALTTGLGRHDVHPILITERDVYCFNDLDWHVGQIKIGIGLG